MHMHIYVYTHYSCMYQYREWVGRHMKCTTGRKHTHWHANTCTYILIHAHTCTDSELPHPRTYVQLSAHQHTCPPTTSTYTAAPPTYICTTARPPTHLPHPPLPLTQLPHPPGSAATPLVQRAQQEVPKAYMSHFHGQTCTNSLIMPAMLK